MSRPTHPALRVLSLNVNGLHAVAKRRHLFAMLQQQSWDIVCLQETHHPDGNMADEWCRAGAGPGLPWRGQTFWHAGTSASRGVAVLIREGALVEDAQVGYRDAQGRILRVDCTFGTQAVSVLSVYAPDTPGPDQSAFFTSTLMAAIPEGRAVLVGGDFNCVESLALDRVGGAATTRRAVGHAAGLVHVERRFDLVDVWREQHPGKVECTHTSSSGAASRLDRWLVSAELLPSASSACILLGFPGDHLAVSVTIEDRAGGLRGPGMWCFPLPLLSDRDFVFYLEEHIPRFLEQDPLSPAYTRRGRWDELKASIRDATQAYSFQAARKRRAVQRRLEDSARAAQVAHAADPDSVAALHSWQAAHHALQEWQSRGSGLAALRAGAVWLDFGEQPTHFFHHVAAERAKATGLASLWDPAAGASFALDSMAGRDSAERVLRTFFAGDADGGLFQPRGVSVEAQDALLGSLDTQLDAAGRAACDAPLTMDDLLAALEASARGKRPGCDGLPYEFYRQFWGQLGAELMMVLEEAFASGEAEALSPLQREGRIVLLFKGGPRPLRERVDAYRPITLQNSDVKLLAKALALRWGPHLVEVVDVTQTGFLPGRFIGDNILAHLEEVDYLEGTQQPGCLVFLDFAKAYDRLDRGWLRRCMGALGFGAGACRWVDVLLGGSEARVSFNGWRTSLFPVLSGVPQGSPVSPLLYVIAAQPMASRLRQLQTQGWIRGISLPDGTCAPVCHQHADDTTLHVSTVGDVRVALAQGVEVFAAASGAALQPAKCKGLLLGGAPVPPAAETPIRFLARGEHVRHLGILLGTDPEDCREVMFEAIIHRIRGRIAHWSTQQLTLLGRVYVAKQVLASMLYHHGTYVMPLPRHQRELERLLVGFVGKGTLVAGASTSLRPRREIYSAPWGVGGLRMADVGAQLQALQAKVVARMLQPERHPWKTLMEESLTGYRGLLQSSLLPWGLGVFAMVSAFQFRPSELSPRVRAYVTAFRQLRPHRVIPVAGLSAAQVLCEPLFHNPCIRGPDGAPLGGSIWEQVAARGLTRVGHLRSALSAGEWQLGEQGPHVLAQLQGALPAEWLSLLSGPCQDLETVEWAREPDTQLVWRWPRDTTRRACFAVTPARRLRLTAPAREPHSELDPCLVQQWSPSWGKRGGGGGTAPAEGAPSPEDRLAGWYLVAAWPLVAVDAAVWGLGKEDLLHYQVHAAADRARVFRLRAVFPGYVAGDALHPRTWQPAQDERRWPLLHTLMDMESGWASVVTAGGLARGRIRTREDFEEGTYEAVWMRSGTPRLHWRERRAATQAADDAALPAPRAGPPPALVSLGDVLAVPEGHERPPWQQAYAHLRDNTLDRGQRAFAWQLLHAALVPRAARVAHDDRLGPTEGVCTHPHCVRVPETITHILLECPLAVSVITWLRDLWDAVTGGGNRPPNTVAVLLGDDQRTWQPRDAGLWMRLRIATLLALWMAAWKRGRDGTPTNAASVAAKVVYGGRSSMQEDWCRVEGDVRLCSRAPIDWFRGRNSSLTPEQFMGRWGLRGVLAMVNTDAFGREHLVIRWSRAHPIPLPRCEPQRT